MASKRRGRQTKGPFASAEGRRSRRCQHQRSRRCKGELGPGGEQRAGIAPQHTCGRKQERIQRSNDATKPSGDDRGRDQEPSSLYRNASTRPDRITRRTEPRDGTSPRPDIPPTQSSHDPARNSAPDPETETGRPGEMQAGDRQQMREAENRDLVLHLSRNSVALP